MRLLAVVALALALPAAALAEAVPGARVDDGVLAVAPDGSPRVAWVSGARLVVAARDTAAAWTASPVTLPGPDAVLESAAVRPSGASLVLAGGATGRWLALVDGTRVRVLARARRRAQLGFAGLALDGNGRPAVAYTLRLGPRRTALRLVREDARGRLTTTAITHAGFPPSTTLPAAAPVLVPSGAVHVVETYDRAAIEWSPSGRDWSGQFLFASPLGTPAGPVAAAAGAGGVYAAWTQLYPQVAESHLLLTVHLAGERTTVVHRHSFLAALALPPEGPELAANDYVGTSFAGFVADATGDAAELDGKIVGYAVDAAGGRQLLLARDGGLEWYRTPSRPAVRVSLSVAGGALSGRVAGASGGVVDLVREPDRTRLGTVAVEPDGSFAAPYAGGLVRAVWSDPATGLPYAALLRTAG